ncbi:MAG TPA: GAF domain-containing protein [Caldimonas sp.]|nr:GAF domain-containing protein [Caldimonas sp.]
MATRRSAPARATGNGGAALRRRLDESLAREAATAGILRVLSRSSGDASAVFAAIADAALRLCDATSAVVTRYDGTLIHIESLSDLDSRRAGAVRSIFPRPPSRDNGTTRAVLTRGVVLIPDVREDPDFRTIDASVASGFLSVLAVPLLREGEPIGAISVGRPVPGPFSDSHIALLHTFADQAVIALENVRLFNDTGDARAAAEQRSRELAESLDYQTATSEVLRVISESPTDVQPVFAAILEAATRLFGAPLAAVFRLEAGIVNLQATHGWSEEALIDARRFYPGPPNPAMMSGRTILARAIQQQEDALADATYDHASAEKGRWRRMVGAPLLRDGDVLGAIVVAWPQAGATPARQVELLKTFADQAVIAIENVRVLRELETRNRELVAALERQTATTDILRVISSSQTSLQPVFDAIVHSAVRLGDADHSIAALYDGESLHALAMHGYRPEAQALVERMFPMRPSATTMLGRATLAGGIAIVEDMLADTAYSREFAQAGGWRSGLGVPMLEGGKVIGAIAVSRTRPGAFQAQHVDLLKTFAEQAVIAIRNVHLFTELQARTTQLSRSVDELQALSEVGRAVGSTLDLDTVLGTIVSRVASLMGVDGGSVYEYDADAERFYLRATDGLPDDLVEALRAAPIGKGEGAMGRLALTGEPVVFSDIEHEALYQSRLRELLLRLGLRSMAAVPLHIEGRLLGGLVVNRRGAGGFPAPAIELLKRFATQSALAIGNARLYREVQHKSRELEAASRHKSEFLANMSHELRTPLNAIIGFSEVLAERMFGEVNDKQLEYLQDIHASGQHLLTLINEILDLSKIEAGRMELELGPVSLSPLIEDALTLVRERAVRHGVALALDLDPQMGPGLADARKVKQAVINLLSNAVKFTPAGGRVTVRTRPVPEGIEIAVADTGVGIAPDDQALVFEEFRQSRTAHPGRSEGTGLGLALVRRFVELHGGRIRVESEPGRGSTFAFILPWRSPEQEAA